ncbi:MAG: hypothetical protein RL701_5191 [Pseudomonadota bacterium]|jgi:Cu/Ag efflux protein CusF
MPRLALILSLLTSLIILSACGPEDPPLRRYHARGIVTEVSSSGAELSVAIHHERIAKFEGRDGKLSDMDSMTMLFGVASDVPRAVWSQGAKVDFEFDMRWNLRPSLWIVRAQNLPPDTELTLPPASEHNEHH